MNALYIGQTNSELTHNQYYALIRTFKGIDNTPQVAIMNNDTIEVYRASDFLLQEQSPADPSLASELEAILAETVKVEKSIESIKKRLEYIDKLLKNH